MQLNHYDTPCLWVDLDIMGSNIQYLAGYFKSRGLEWRPHTKGIKIPEIAKLAINAGAFGVTCAKLSEAELMTCLLYTSPSPRDLSTSRMPSSA